MSRTVLISKIAAMNIIREDQIQDFENNLGKYLGPEELTIELFVQCLSCYLTQYNLIFSLLKIFESVEILESYGTLYIKLRVPKHDKTIGYITYSVSLKAKVMTEFNNTLLVKPRWK